MPATSARSRRIAAAAAIVAAAAAGTVAGTSARIDATTPPTTTPATAAPTTAASPTTGPTAAAPTTAAPTTFPGPTPRGAERVASPVDIEKIRATSLPLRRMGIGVGILIALLAIAGFVYGKFRSRVPIVKVPKPASAAAPPVGATTASPATPLPPPAAIPLPPPVVEDAVADTVIFEPPASHQTPHVIASETVEALDETSPDETSTADVTDRE